MQFYKHLYLEEGISEKKSEKIIEKLKSGKVQPFIHVITLSSNPKNHLDIIPSVLLLQPSYPTDDLFVVGISRGNEEAILMVRDIVEEVYKNTGSTDIRNYLLQREMD